MTSTPRIRELNDKFRQSFIGGRVLATIGIRDSGEAFMSAAMEAVQNFDAFTPDNDPHNEHDFGSIVVNGQKVFWKIDYYSADLTSGSPNPSDPNETCRVLTIMLAREY